MDHEIKMQGSVGLTGRIRVLPLICLGHFVVDACCIMLVVNLSGNAGPAVSAFLILLYDMLAFATQPVFGFLADKMNKPGKTAAIGCIVTVAGMLFHPFPFLAVCISGIGNAFFHVGGGIISLKLDPGKAWAPGLFIAPGTLGVFVGTLLGKQIFEPWIPIGILAALALLHIYIKTPLVSRNGSAPEQNPESNNVFKLALLFILITVVVRSFAGLGISYSWKTEAGLSFILTLFIMFGKALGGILSDRYGLLKVPLAGLILSVPCLVLGYAFPIAGSLGMLLFNLTMPVTLLLSANLFPKHEGLGFGMTVLALSVGTIPVFSGIRLASGFAAGVVVLVSAATFLIGYKCYGKMSRMDQ